MRWESLIRLPLVPGLITALLLLRLMTRGLPVSGIAFLLVSIVWFGFSLIDWLVNYRRRRSEERRALERALRESQAPLSLVFLLAEPRRVSLERVVDIVRDELGADLDEAEAVVEAETPATEHETLKRFLIRLPYGVFAILVSRQPYLAEPGAFARTNIRDKRLRTAVEEHRAWLSVDLISATPEETEGRYRAYATVGRLLASVAGPDCLAIYSPELKRCNEFDPVLIERLRAGEPLRIFDEPTFEPVIEIEEDHPRMVEAVEEALRRWPEFAAAFLKRERVDDDRFIVKAEFVEGGRSEFMWVAVTDIEGGRISGVLMNDPHQLESVHRGKHVTIQIDRLNDWLFPDEKGEAVGGFTLRVLADDNEDRQNRRRNRPRGDDEDENELRDSDPE
ncbi:MAG: DUF2314 domain-containing protein [Verrucomicrobiae bacterium]|nr:DUF2314 domain-containing protein [Verrucomicrobiae bacterium]